MALRDSAGYDGSLDFMPGGPSGKDWLDEFRNDLSSVIHALSVWKDYAIDTMHQALDFNGGNVGPFSYEGPFSVPNEFKALTDIIALWCDTELHIDPTALTEVRRRFLAFAPKRQARRLSERVSMTDSEVEQMLDRAMDCYYRVFHATLARYPREQQERAILEATSREWSPPATMKTWTRRLKNCARTLRSWRKAGTLRMEKVNGQRGLWRLHTKDPRYIREWDKNHESPQE